MRWNAFVDCPRYGCDGHIEYWLDEVIQLPKLKLVYLYCCTKCNSTGNWETFARQQHARSKDADRGRSLGETYFRDDESF